MVFFAPRLIVTAIALFVGALFAFNGIRTLRRSKEGGRPFGIIELSVGVVILGAVAYSTVF